MKQAVGFTAIVAFAVAAARMPSARQAPVPRPAAMAALDAPHELPKSAAALKLDYTGGCTAYEEELSRPASRKEKSAAAAPKDANFGAARSVINTFFAIGSNEQLRVQQKVRYAIALTPDPRHTHLGLVFDREIVSIQQAAQDEGFAYNSSWMPWQTEAEQYPRLEDQQRADEDTADREACPGVLLFRKGVNDQRNRGEGASPERPYDEALVVLVVGEQPTGGLNEGQWTNALRWLNRSASPFVAALPRTAEDTSVDQPPQMVSRPLSILGPSFSGSLTALQRDLEVLHSGKSGAYPSASTPIHILSGSVRSCTSIRWFQRSLNRIDPRGDLVFGSFQENDELQIHRFLNYLSQQGYHTNPDNGNAEIAILAEDETAYAAPAYAAPAYAAPARSKPSAGDDGRGSSAPCSFPYGAANRPLHLAYPRDISALRVAYEKQSLFSPGASEHASHLILQEDAASELQSGAASDTVRTFSGAMGPVAQEAVLYGIVSSLRAHHPHFVLLRCTNPLDVLFLTRFFHRTYPQGRVVTVGSDLLFRREIDTTEFRGVLSLTNYPLLPSNQHWSHVAVGNDESPSHTHRVFDSHVEGVYLAARYLFDGGASPLNVPGDKGHPPAITLRYKAELLESAVPFWIEDNKNSTIQPPTWLSVVGRDGYWPVAVLNRESMPASEALRRPDHFDGMPEPPSTLVQIAASGNHHDLAPNPPPVFRHSLLFGVTLPTKIAIGCAFLLLLYQLFGIRKGCEYSSIGLFSLFRKGFAPSQALLLGVNSAFAAVILVQLLWVVITPRAYRLYLNGFSVVSPLSILSALLAVTLAFFVYSFSRKQGLHDIATASFVAVLVSLTLAPYAFLYSFRTEANGVPLFYRMSHLVSGVSPLVPVLLLIIGFYVWTWQAMAGNSLLSTGHPRLPSKREVRPVSRGLRRQYLRFLGIDVSGTPEAAPQCLSNSEYRISGEMEKQILVAASPLSLEPRVLLLPMIFVLVAALNGYFSRPPLLGVESHGFATFVNILLLIAFLLTTAEGARLFFTWVELRRLLTALDRQRFRRTFAKLRAVSVGSLWSVSGSVQRIQYLFFSQQQDAANRLARILWPNCPLTAKAVAASRAFASRTAPELNAGPRWDQRVLVDVAKFPELSGTQSFFIRDVLNDAAGELINQVLLPAWRREDTSLNLQTRPAGADDHERNASEMELSTDPAVKAAEEFVCLHYIAFIQNALARMRTMILSMVSLFVAVCLSISFYPFVPRTQIGLWMLANLALISGAVIYVYAGMERDETLSYITNTPAGRLGADFYLKTAAFLAGPVLGLLTTQFPAISESFLSWVQPSFDALR